MSHVHGILHGLHKMGHMTTEGLHHALGAMGEAAKAHGLEEGAKNLGASQHWGDEGGGHPYGDRGRRDR